MGILLYMMVALDLYKIYLYVLFYIVTKLQHLLECNPSFSCSKLCLNAYFDPLKMWK